MYIALKTCKFAGQNFLAGESIPEELVDVRAVRRLKKQRILMVVDEQKEEQKDVVVVPAMKQLFAVPILTKESSFSVDLEAEELKTLFVVLQSNADKAGHLIAEQVNKDLLLCVHALDSRKSVKEAAKDKATALIEAENAADVEENTVPDENAAELPENGAAEPPVNDENETNEESL